MLTCTRCGGTGFLNLHQIPAAETDAMESDPEGDIETGIRNWIDAHAFDEPKPDVQVCDCCGNGYVYYGERGQHYSTEDPPGPTGPYSYNGGLSECN